MSSPIIFCHYGNSDYLRYTLKSARFFNPHTEIVLLGDSSNFNLAITENIRHEYLSKFESHHLVQSFENSYIHIAGVNHGREFWLKFNFKRYYYINAFLESELIDSCWYFDSDVMILSNLSSQEYKFEGFDFSVQNNVNGYIKSRQALVLFLSHNISSFSNEIFLCNQKNKIQNNPDLALTEMATFNTFIQTGKIKFIKLNTVINDESFDDCILNSDGMILLNKRINGKTFKKLYFDLIGNIYCRETLSLNYIKMITLNMSGSPTLFYRKILFSSITSKSLKNLDILSIYKFSFNFYRYNLFQRFWHKLLSKFI